MTHGIIMQEVRKMNEYNKSVEIKITQDKLVDLLLHAATREDIGILRQEMKEETASLRQEIKSESAKLNQKIEESVHLLRQDSSAFESRIDRQIQKIDSRYNWIIGTIIAAVIGLASLIIKMH